MDLEAIEERLAAATQGQWDVDTIPETGESRVVVRSNAGDPILDVSVATHGVRAEDAEFIAHAPEDIRALIDVVKRLRRFLNTGAKRVVAVEEIEGLRAQVEAAKAAQLQIEEVKALHCDVGASQGYSKSGRYEVIEHCCGQCGSFGEYGAKYPCPTMRALGVTE